MKSRLTHEIARLASSRYQDRFILNGTKDEYVLPEEIIDTVRGTIATILANPLILRSYSELEVIALKRLDDIASTAYRILPWELGSGDVILSHPEWQRLQTCAQSCLRDFGFDLETWERSERSRAG